MSLSLVIVHIIYFPCVFYLSLLHFTSFFLLYFFHITGSVINRVCGEYEAAVPAIYIYILC